jgi:DNA-directed RNA polymerase specialized sigma24 family protein
VTPADAVELARRYAGGECKIRNDWTHFEDLVAAGLLRWCSSPWRPGAGTSETNWGKDKIRWGIGDELRAIYGRRHSRPTFLPFVVDAGDGEMAVDPPDPQAGPEEWADVAATLLEILSVCTPTQRRTVLALTAGESAAEIARREGVTDCTVSLRRRQIRERWAA